MFRWSFKSLRERRRFFARISFSDYIQGNDFEQIVACGETIWQEQVRGREVARTTKTVLSQSSRPARLWWEQMQQMVAKDGFNEFLRAFGGCFAPRLVHKCSGRWSAASGRWSGVMISVRDWKVLVSFRLDPRCSLAARQGEGHLTRINDILTNLMELNGARLGR